MHPLTKATTATEIPVSEDDLAALAAATAKINDMFVASYDWTDRTESPTGERFTETVEGPYPEAAAAIEQMIVRFTLCCKHSPGATLYWRVHPEMNNFRGKYGGYRVYFRYLITTKQKRD